MSTSGMTATARRLVGRPVNPATLVVTGRECGWRSFLIPATQWRTRPTQAHWAQGRDDQSFIDATLHLRLWECWRQRSPGCLRSLERSPAGVC